jgi:hypothetical protein
MLWDNSPIYWNPLIYRALMRYLYGRTYNARYSSVADLLPDRCSVTDLCCGCGSLYTEHLIHKDVTYVGVDQVSRLMRLLNKYDRCLTVVGDACDVDLVNSDYCVMVGSLYHFHPREASVIERMAAIGKLGVVVESVQRAQKSRRHNPLLRFVAERIGYVRHSSYRYRLDSDRLDDVLAEASINVLRDDSVVDGLYRRVLFERI